MTEAHNGKTALITGASEGIGAVYADRLATRGYNLVLVARSIDKLEALATTLRQQTGRSIEILPADLANRDDLQRVEARLAATPAVDLLVNNAGINKGGSFAELSSASVSAVVDLNVTAVARLAWAASGPMVARGSGTIINIASVMALMHMPTSALYSATKAFVLTLTQALDVDLAGKGVHLQAVLPGATRTAIWAKSGTPVEYLPQEIVMETEAMVDASLAGLDQGELVTIPALPERAHWDQFEAARHQLAPNLSRAQPAGRYL
ncbi:SDR family oxidoreductase [Devosia sp.]|uniref:SDR family NAD(P)-dependent oxidoreductase n=1 Tax=Devosia sp. TaxID=1871048 RepID=UPI003264E475